MIPPDVASSLRLVQPDQRALPEQQNQPVAPAQRIADVLSNAVPGQRIMAEIQAMLPNGTYRALVAQRDVTLALPFSAKPGDTLELEVTESDGKLTLAFVTNRTETPANKSSPESVPTSLSSTGKLIGDLMSGIDGEGKRAPPAPLNGSQPIVESMPKSAADLAPVLKQALTQSGMFYEAHQARWVAGEMPTEALKLEPQGKIAVAGETVAVNLKNAAKMADGNTSVESVTTPGNQTRNESVTLPGLPREMVPLVQQQLDGLANQNFAWQGQIWPGQQMRWEIGENPEDRRAANETEPQHWQSRLKLSLPMLGAIDVALSLRAGGDVRIAVTADSENSKTRLQEGVLQLKKQFETAGLNLTDCIVQHDETGS